jgi:syntaxin 1B/2/3
VKPDATPAEVDAVVNDTSGAGGQIFAQAVRFFLVDSRLSALVLTALTQLTSSTRYDQSRLAYREAQERHEEILRIEQNMAELAQLMNDVRCM